jgi:hypothetical protein
MAFDTIPQVYEGKMKHISLWQLKAGFLTSEKTLRATKLKEHANKAKQTETVTPPTTQQVQDISFSPEGDTSPIQRATETHQGDSLPGSQIHEHDSERGPGTEARERENDTGELRNKPLTQATQQSDNQTQEQAQTQSAQQQGPLR